MCLFVNDFEQQKGTEQDVISLRLIKWCLTPFSTVFQSYRGVQCTSPYFPALPLTCTPHNIPYKPPAGLTHNHCRNNRQQ